MGKKPLSENHVKSLRKLVADNPLHSLLLNLSVDLMLRSSDLLSLKVSDLLHESGKVKSDVKVKTKKTGKTTLSLPLSKNSIDAIKRHLEVSDMDKYVFRGNKSHYTNKPITSLCSDREEVDDNVGSGGHFQVFNPFNEENQTDYYLLQDKEH